MPTDVSESWNQMYLEVQKYPTCALSDNFEEHVDFSHI